MCCAEISRGPKRVYPEQSKVIGIKGIHGIKFILPIIYLISLYVSTTNDYYYISSSHTDSQCITYYGQFRPKTLIYQRQEGLCM
jgi:hypothetical protein